MLTKNYIKGYSRKNNIAKKVFSGGLVLTTISAIGLGALFISLLDMKTKLESLPKHNVADIRKTYEQGLKNNRSLSYFISGLTLLSIEAVAISKKLYKGN